MFTGLVEEAGIVVGCEVQSRSASLTVAAQLVSDGIQIGDSVAINGTCLTVVAVNGDQLTFDAVPETLARTNLGALNPGAKVNLERPLQVGARLGGHFVSGHIDGVGVVTNVAPDENAVIYTIEIPGSLRRYFIEKGSVSVDGVSLTVAGIEGNQFTVWIIPHTREVTTFGDLKVGDRVNLECDLLGKYIEKLLEEREITASV